MPKILITGNGFDLNLNLPTAYQDFMNITIFVKDKNVEDLTFYNVYQNVGDWKYKKLKENITDNFSFSENNNIEELKSKLAKNVWFDFFKSELEIETWIDFETKINYVLNTLVNAIDLVNEIYFKNKHVKSCPSLSKHKINNSIEYVNILLKMSCINEKLGSSNYEINEVFLIKKYDSFLGFNHEKIMNFLYEQLNEFIEIFCMYFRIFVYPLYDYVKQHVNNDWFKDIDYHFTFNYTPSFEKLYDSSKKTKTFFLHGKIENDKNNIVLGINEMPESVINRKFYFPFTKYYQKLNKDTDYQFLENLTFDSKQNGDITFYIWGHSLDVSDDDYINEIFNFVDIERNLNKGIREIVIIYHNLDSKSNLLLNLLHIRGKKDIESKMKNKQLIFRQSGSNYLEESLRIPLVDLNYKKSDDYIFDDSEQPS